MHSKTVELLTSAHRMMEHLLNLIRLQVDMLHPLMEGKELAFLQKAIGYMHNYPGLIHHPAEELIFERLRNHAPDTLQLCTKLIEQHKQFSILEITLLEYINQAQKGETSTYALIKQLANTYCMEQVDHISVEENDLLPQAISFLTAEDWLEIGYKSNLDMDPLSKPDILKNHDNLYDYIMSINLNLKTH